MNVQGVYKYTGMYKHTGGVQHGGVYKYMPTTKKWEKTLFKANFLHLKSWKIY